MFSGNKPDCIKCGYVIAMPENYEILDVLERYAHTMTDGDGSIKIESIEAILSKNKVETSESNIYKVVIYLSKALQKRQEDIRDGTQNRARVLSKGQRDSDSQTSHFVNKVRPQGSRKSF